MEFKTELLSPSHVVDDFDCGETPLNDYLNRFALPSQSAGAARVYVLAMDSVVIGYYSLSAGSVDPASASKRILKGLPRQPVPIVLLGRLAVGQPQQGRGLGKLLVRDAILRFLQAADIIGARSFLVRPNNEAVANFYMGIGFEALPVSPLHMALLQEDARATIRQPLSG